MTPDEHETAREEAALAAYMDRTWGIREPGATPAPPTFLGVTPGAPMEPAPAPAPATSPALTPGERAQPAAPAAAPAAPAAPAPDLAQGPRSAPGADEDASVDAYLAHHGMVNDDESEG